mmetsp:Transcript_117503/g.292963  ORF Transcript_117503/g.292963 Transcript_117503/m.292963 type:complete len:254 (-) Transcript_117503:33-794(-)
MAPLLPLTLAVWLLRTVGGNDACIGDDLQDLDPTSALQLPPQHGTRSVAANRTAARAMRRAAALRAREQRAQRPRRAKVPAAAGAEFTACGERTGPCDVPHIGPGCSQTQCCEAVCAQDGFCCDVSWDEICIEDNIELCDDLPVPPAACSLNTGYCLQEREAGGCSDPACCAEVCAADAFCCQQGWDSLCVEEAIERCDLLRCTPIAETCDSAHRSPGCSDVQCCQDVCEEDDFCCFSEWDGQCAAAASSRCS